MSAEERGSTERIPPSFTLVTYNMGSEGTDFVSWLVFDPGEGPVCPLAGRAGHFALNLGRVFG